MTLCICVFQNIYGCLQIIQSYFHVPFVNILRYVVYKVRTYSIYTNQHEFVPYLCAVMSWLIYRVIWLALSRFPHTSRIAWKSKGRFVVSGKVSLSEVLNKWVRCMNIFYLCYIIKTLIYISKRIILKLST